MTDDSKDERKIKVYVEKLFSLKGKVAIVTGGSSGIGQTVTQGLAQAGAKVVILSRSSADKTIKLVNEAGGIAHWIKTDVTKEEEVNEALSTILDTYKSVDLLFNNAGICMHQSSFDTTIEEFRKVIDVNLTGQFIVARAVAKIMKERNIRGSMINMASMSGSIVNIPQMQCSYNSSKAAVIHMTKSLAVELAKDNIRVNSISPGYVATPMALETDPELKDEWNKLIPMNRFAKPEELMTAILYLASDSSSYTTGSNVIIDGAYTCV